MPLLGVRVQLLLDRILELIDPNDKVLVFVRRGVRLDVDLLAVTALLALAVVRIVRIFIVRGGNIFGAAGAAHAVLLMVVRVVPERMSSPAGTTASTASATASSPVGDSVILAFLTRGGSTGSGCVGRSTGIGSS